MCSHITPWYLNNARHKANAFGVQYCRVHVLDAAEVAEVPLAVEDSSDSESGERVPEA